VSGEGYAPHGAITLDGGTVDAGTLSDVASVARAALLCNDAALRRDGVAYAVEGDPMEGALVAFAAKAGLEEQAVRREIPRTDEIPFDAMHRFMATLHPTHDGGSVIYVKGAPERVLSMCARQMRGDGEEPLNRELWEGLLSDLASRGERVIAFAARRGAPHATTLTFEDVDGDLMMLGLTGIMDPPREEAIRAVAQCREAGIGVKMITGDHVETAAAIAAQLGMPGAGRVATGHDLDRVEASAFDRLVAETAVFARTTPEHKLRIVTALQEQGETVAMTGDGVNDGPALKRADVGVAMGIKGSEVAKDAAEMVLADDNFASIVAAVREGRTVYDNLKKVIAWTLPTDGGEGACLVAAIVVGATLPLSPLHILWVNTITAVALGLTLAFEPTEPDVMRRRPRRRDEAILSGFLVWRIVFVSLLFAAGAFGIFEWGMDRTGSLDAARTMVVNLFVVFEIFYLFSIRYLDQPSLTLSGVRGTPVLLAGIGASIAFQLLFTYAPFMNRLFRTAPLDVVECAAVIGAGAALFLVLEVEKAARRLLARARRRAYPSGQGDMPWT
ncbi:MAG: HAD-IC family P-type ATPase, partial [Alphaproteobacteria bacterium]|nr:HAD-IC family P-type ATPase [Alphaproteobacteria bacterium]